MSPPQQPPSIYPSQQPSIPVDTNPSFGAEWTTPNININNNPSIPEWNPQTPSYNDPNFNETFYEIGGSIPRAKREIKFPDEETTTLEDVQVITDVDIETLSGVEGKAMPQLMQSVTKIDVGPQSQLFVAPGSTSVIYFEVTNLRNEPTYHNFNVQDEKRFLRNMEPRL